jgi:hypothetical protein
MFAAAGGGVQRHIKVHGKHHEFSHAAGILQEKLQFLLTFAV